MLGRLRIKHMERFGKSSLTNTLGINKSHVKSITSLLPHRGSGSGNFPVTGPKPSGIRLHLNSIINVMPVGRAATAGVRLSDGLQGMKSTSSISLHKVDNMKRSVPQSNTDGRSLVDTRNESHEIDASVATDSFISEFPGTTEPVPHIFYNDPCSCQGCLNKPEFAETADDIRQQIQSRNPLAFDPKIVQPTTDISSNNMEDINLTTPSSARHKKGCNCKSGCQCEGRKNVYGKKEDYVALEHALSKERGSKSVKASAVYGNKSICCLAPRRLIVIFLCLKLRQKLIFTYTVLRQRETQCPVIHPIAREVFTCLVMQPIMDIASPNGDIAKWKDDQELNMFLYRVMWDLVITWDSSLLKALGFGGKTLREYAIEKKGRPFLIPGEEILEDKEKDWGTRRLEVLCWGSWLRSSHERLPPELGSLIRKDGKHSKKD
ncbi:hypothetical protein VNO77_04133 [Canavalia gladiata]|uniref:Uncharacterized protein n=1 Tax=Canavalia gladiata TaxID=3824 RepID=A0AAN9MVZ7_CANGL